MRNKSGRCYSATKAAEYRYKNPPKARRARRPSVAARRPSIAARGVAEATGQPAAEIQEVARSSGAPLTASAQALETVHAIVTDLTRAAAATGQSREQVALEVAKAMAAEGQENNPEVAQETLQLIAANPDDYIDSLLEAEEAPAGAGLRRSRSRRY